MATYAFGVDHGNGNIKTAGTVFPAGFTRQQVPPAGVFSDDWIEYGGAWYVLSRERFPYKIDKTQDEDCFILTLFAIAKEVRARLGSAGWGECRGFDASIVLAAGLPPTHFEKLGGPFSQYFLERGGSGVSFSYDGVPFRIRMESVSLYPQGYAAVACFKGSLMQRYRTVYCMDIGDGTVDLLGLSDGKPDKTVMASREIGVSRMRERIIDRVINDFSYTLDATSIEDALTPGRETLLDYDVVSCVRHEAEEWAGDVARQMRMKVPDFRTAPTVFCGGGAMLLRPYIEGCGLFGKTEYITDIRANAIGYERITVGLDGEAEQWQPSK